ncbi:MAG: hypothetical protein Q8R48_01775 [Candidatus Omnitrophota bacterium]|nr:hypothetical protein [Candidatus Omnitrophota bacterium]
MDILVEPTAENAKRIVKALNEFGFASREVSEKDFSEKGRIMQLGYEPVRIDIITSIAGCSFKEIWRDKAVGMYGKEKVFFIGLKDLIKSKKKAAREQDKADLNILLNK